MNEGAPAPAQDYVPKKDDDKEATTYEPRSQGERDFIKSLGKTIKIPHPVAGEHQFTASFKEIKEDEQLNELSKKTLGSYVKKACGNPKTTRRLS